MLENTNTLNNTIKDVDMRKLQNRLLITIARYNITTEWKLKQVAQEEGVFEIIYDIIYDRPRSQSFSITLVCFNPIKIQRTRENIKISLTMLTR